MGRTKSDDIGSDDSGRLYEPEPGEQEQDPVSSLHDTDEETGCLLYTSPSPRD